MPSLFDSQTPRNERHATPPHQHISFEARPMNGDHFVLDDLIGGPSRRTQLHTDNAVPLPGRHAPNSYETVKCNTRSKSEELYCDVSPGEITPYVGLRARLTQVPINRWTVLLLLALARLLILFDSVTTNLTDAQQEVSSACAKAEEVGSAMASLPHYASTGVNELLAMRITDTVRALINVVMMITTGILDILLFMVERIYGTMTCVAVSFVKALISLATLAVQDLIKDIDDALQAVAGVVASVLDSIKNNPLIGGVISDIGGLDDLDSAVDKLKDGSFINGTSAFNSLNNFNKMVPTFDEMMDAVKAVIQIPLNDLQNLLNESLGSWTMDPAAFPTASKESLTFCTGDDTMTKLFGVLFIVVKSAKIIAIAGLVLASLLAAVFMFWYKVQRYRRIVVKSRVLRDREPMDAIYTTGRPVTSAAGLWISRKISRDSNRQMLIRWVVAYSTTYTALFVLSLAVGAGFSVLCQYFIMRAVQKESPALAQGVGTFVTNAMDALNRSSSSWANDSNQAILNMQNDINGNVLDHVQDATAAVVSLINAFENQTTTFLHNFFGNSDIGKLADNFVEDLLGCIIMNAIDEAKRGIEWVNSEAHVTFPEFPADVFSMSATGSGNTSIGVLLTNAATQTVNEVTAALSKTIIALQSGIIHEGVIALCLFLVYVAYVLCAAAQAALRMCCFRERKPLADAEKRAETVGKPDYTSSHSQDRMPATPHRTSRERKYRLPDLSFRPLAHESSVEVPDRPNPSGRSWAGHGESQVMQNHAVAENPFDDDKYFIG